MSEKPKGPTIIVDASGFFIDEDDADDIIKVQEEIDTARAAGATKGLIRIRDGAILLPWRVVDQNTIQ